MRLSPARRRRVFVLSACGPLAALWAASAAAEVPDVDSLVASLARSPPTTVEFAEARFSALLVAPLIVGGELAYPAAANLERIVTTPHRERTSIHGDSVSVTRDGERSRTFALRRAPELRGMLTLFIGLLAGDAGSITSEFEVSVSGSTDAWKLELTPRDTALRRRLTALTANGAGGDLRCITMRNPDDGATVMLLGATAAGGIAADATLAGLLGRCGIE
jgi:hypothetical protein